MESACACNDSNSIAFIIYILIILYFIYKNKSINAREKILESGIICLESILSQESLSNDISFAIDHNIMFFFIQQINNFLQQRENEFFFIHLIEISPKNIQILLIRLYLLLFYTLRTFSLTIINSLKDHHSFITVDDSSVRESWANFICEIFRDTIGDKTLITSEDSEVLKSICHIFRFQFSSALNLYHLEYSTIKPFLDIITYFFKTYMIDNQDKISKSFVGLGNKYTNLFLLCNLENINIEQARIIKLFFINYFFKVCDNYDPGFLIQVFKLINEKSSQFFLEMLLLYVQKSKIPLVEPYDEILLPVENVALKHPENIILQNLYHTMKTKQNK